MSSAHASLDGASIDRKARLAKLASIKRKEPESELSPKESEETIDTTIRVQKKTDTYLSGRNFDVQSRGPKLGFENSPASGQATLEEQAESIALGTAEQARRDEEANDKGVDLFKLQPKKPNWDLKRDLDEKTKILNVRTQNAIARLVRERIEKAKQDALLKSEVVREDPDKEGGEEVGIEGNTLVEGVHLREREEQEDERKQREMDEDEIL